MSLFLTGDALRAKLAEPDGWLLPGEAGLLLRVDPKTLSRWRSAGYIPLGDVVRLPGGHTRISCRFVREILNGGPPRSPGDLQV